jgi:hypothetical protein
LNLNKKLLKERELNSDKDKINNLNNEIKNLKKE